MRTTTLPPQAVANGRRLSERTDRLPYRPEDLFQEPSYTDGQPYASDDEDDEPDA